MAEKNTEDNIKNLTDTSLSEDFDKLIDKCYNDEKPPCTCACPLGLDVIEFLTRLKRGRVSSAYSLYRDYVLFPEIVSRVCDQPCQKVCVRKDIDDAISMRQLEAAAVQFALSSAPKRLGLPKKNKRTAVVGAGLCGLSCTLRLASHGYHVTVYEKSGCIGGNLWDILPSEFFLPEIQNQMQFIEYELIVNSEIKSIGELAEKYDAILIATGKSGESFGLLPGLNRHSLGSERMGVFLAGGAAGASTPVESIENGIRASQSIESYLQINRMHEMVFVNQAVTSRLKVNTSRVTLEKRVESESYTKEEAVREAERCLLCNCKECIHACSFLSRYNKSPRALAENVRNTLNGTLMNVHKRMVNSCSNCGLCEAVCAEDINLGTFLLEARRIMHRKGALPPAFHDYFLRDMKFAQSQAAYLAKNAPGCDKSEYVFFPGCQLGASDPQYVEKPYKYLLSRNPETGIIVGCCGVPAQWAGDEALTAEIVEANRKAWEDMGKPKVVFACPTCEKMLAQQIPEMTCISLYTLIDLQGLPECHTAGNETVSVFDPCASRYDGIMQRSVRNLLENIGYDLEELSYHGKTAQCCGNGGQIYSTDPELVYKSADKAIELGQHPYITYCANCRDVFADRCKPCRHVIDVLFDLNNEMRKPPSLTERRKNREALKAVLLKGIWKEDYALDTKEPRLNISPELLQILNRRLILEEDIYKVIEHCESSGNKLLNPKTGDFIGHLKQEIITYWVTYSVEGDRYRVVNAYSHRAVIDGE